MAAPQIDPATREAVQAAYERFRTAAHLMLEVDPDWIRIYFDGAACAIATTARAKREAQERRSKPEETT